VFCATDDESYADIAKYYGADVSFLRPKMISNDNSPDIEWVSWVIENFKMIGEEYDIFSILRPTNPFRLPETIKRAFNKFINNSNSIHSLRAIEKCKQHPGKMWLLDKNIMNPLLPNFNGDVPWHSCQYPSLPEVYIQNASLEIAWTSVLENYNSISGEIITPFISEGFEGFDINLEEDWIIAQYIIENNIDILPSILLNSFYNNKK
jgi:CMP-N,N'-diacetyllegionaminic acid synthase